MDGIVTRAGVTLGRPWRWLRPVARRYVERFAAQVRPTQRTVAEFLRQDPSFQRAWKKGAAELKVTQWVAGPQSMEPIAAARSWDIPHIESAGALAEWLHVSAGELAWLADLKTIAARASAQPLKNYHYRVLQNASGSLRLIEAPKRRLKQIQRKILDEILEPIPAHPAVHGFLKNHSIKTFVAEHVGRRVVLRMDLRHFFPSIGRVRIQALFRAAGYPEPVANLLGGICTSVTPRRMWNGLALRAGSGLDEFTLHEMRSFYARPHLPQGAPTSPALANICAYRVDCRLSGLARAAGARYTRYADDLAFSGDEEFDRSVERFSIRAAAIVEEEGFTVNYRKTRIMRAGVRQYLAGLVTNARINVVRVDFDRLKATLTNCVRHGPESQNRDSHPHFRMHLEGRVAFVESINAEKGARLRTLLDAIRW